MVWVGFVSEGGVLRGYPHQNPSVLALLDVPDYYLVSVK